MDNEKLISKANEYLTYFSDESDKLKASYDKCVQLEKTMDDQISAITAQPAGRGTQHYLIDHITNAISLQSEKQSIAKDMSDLKKTALGYAIKDMVGDDDTSGKDNVLAMLSELIKQEKKSEAENKTDGKKIQNDSDLDAEIEAKLNKSEK
jgi:hypothetical protein